MSGPRSFWWFARFEIRLAWRDIFSMLTADRRGRGPKLAIGVILLPIFLHLIAFLMLYSLSGEIRPDQPTLILVTAGIVLSASAMLAQSMESVTRTFYVRGDLELILSSPMHAGKLFAVRIMAMAMPAVFMSMVVIGPFIDVLAWRFGIQWLAGYGVLIAASLASTAMGVVLTVLLFGLIGPKRTRLMAQIAAAVVGGAFVIGLQVGAMLSMGSVSRLAFLRSQYVISHAPDLYSLFWLPARAALGDGRALTLVLLASILFFWAVIARYAPRFTDYALVAAGSSDNGNRRQRKEGVFRVRLPSSALRLKERRLLLRDPWLISQTLMQLLYLFPPALLLWHSIGQGTGASIILVPVLIMTAGQLAGGLAWLTVSGEDAPDLVTSAPVTMRGLLRAKIEVVMQCIGVVLFPFVASLALISARQAVFVVIGSAAAAASSTAIQIWFRSQAKRSQFRRRHSSSRIATLSEALVSIAWAAAGTVSVLSIWLAAILAVVALLILACVRALSPERRYRSPQPVMRLRVAPHETSS
jgi:ABC-2 type transport system permease protein